MSAPSVADAIAGARHEVRADAPLLKTVLIAGAAGRLGERVLTRALGAPNYRTVYALADDAMPSTEPRLTVLTEAEWAMPVDHMIVVVGADQGAVHSAAARRTEVFSSVSPEQVIPLARRARELGVRRFMLVTPIDVLLQPAALRARVGNVMEAELHAMGFDSLLLVRPSDAELRHRQAGMIPRLLRAVVDTATGLLSGQRYVPLSLEKAAQAMVYAMHEPGEGLNVLETEHLQLLAAG